MKRGYFGIGIYQPKTEENVGTLWRAAQLYGADFIFTIGTKYQMQASDTLKTTRHIPLHHYLSVQDFIDHVPHGARIVCIEQVEKSVKLPEFKHPQQCVYLLGREDNGIPKALLEKYQVVEIPTKEPQSMNVAMAGSVVLYDRFIKYA